MILNELSCFELQNYSCERKTTFLNLNILTIYNYALAFKVLKMLNCSRSTVSSSDAWIVSVWSAVCVDQCSHLLPPPAQSSVCRQLSQYLQYHQTFQQLLFQSLSSTTELFPSPCHLRISVLQVAVKMYKTIFISNIQYQGSIYLTVAITIERFITVCHPFYRFLSMILYFKYLKLLIF